MPILARKNTHIRPLREEAETEEADRGGVMKAIKIRDIKRIKIEAEVVRLRGEECK